MIKKQTILKTLKDHKDEIRHFGVSQIGMFGSYAREENRQDSDLDVLVEMTEKKFDNYMGLKEFLENLFKIRVDLVLKDNIKPGLKETILKEAVYAEGL